MKTTILTTQRQVLEKRIKTLSVTIDADKVTSTQNGEKFLPAGTILGQDAVGNGTGEKVDLLLNRSTLVRPSNDGKAFGILTHDVFFFDSQNQQATICYGGVAYILEVEKSLTQIKGSADVVHADAITGMSEMTFKKI